VRDLYQVEKEKFSLIHRKNGPLNSIVVGKVVRKEEFVTIRHRREGHKRIGGIDKIPSREKL